MSDWVLFATTVVVGLLIRIFVL